MKEDLEFAKRTEEAWKEIEAGKCTSYPVEKFLKEIKNDINKKRIRKME